VLRLQTPEEPAEVRNAIIDLLDPQTSDVRIASAYVTLGGSEILFGCLSEFLTQDRLNKIPKTLITCLDFGITEPEALQHWGSMPNTTVRVAGAHLLDSGSLLPRHAFHPKVYAFGVRSAHANVLVGSANMTSRGFSINTEAVWLEWNVAVQRVDHLFSTAAVGTAPFSDDLLSAYKSLRRRRPPPAGIEGRNRSRSAPATGCTGSTTDIPGSSRKRRVGTREVPGIMGSKRRCPGWVR
jgi:HKD family nuclease